MLRIKPYIVIIHNEQELREWGAGKWLPNPKEYPCLAIITADRFEEYFYTTEVRNILAEMEKPNE